MKKPPIDEIPQGEDFDTMLDIGEKLRREAKRKEVEAEQERLRAAGADDERTD